MRLTSPYLALLVISLTLFFSSCKDNTTPTEPLQGKWSLFSGHVGIQVKVHSTDVITDLASCFYDVSTASPSTIANRLTINANQTGNLSWNIPCDPLENQSFTWRLSGDNELTLDHLSGASWIWKITSLSAEFMEVEFSREKSIESPSQGPATEYKNFSLKFRKDA